MNIQSLEFHEIEGDAPVFTCNTCGKCGAAKGWRMADIPIGDQADTVSIVVCSVACERAFKAHPMATEYVNDLLARVHGMRGGV
ncbi:MAG: hypothetical protein DMF64_19090 [Acidobacteria bacterium]|nr:MAG: hypothetical protein DMF64_19090 [Acidobacteriota bacterium]